LGSRLTLEQREILAKSSWIRIYHAPDAYVNPDRCGSSGTTHLTRT
jgi:hypothetical protein